MLGSFGTKLQYRLEPNVPLGPLFGPPFERNSTSIFSFELRNWIKKGPDGHGRTDTHDFLEPPLHNKPFGQQDMKPSAIKPHDLAKSGGSGSVFLDILGELAVEVRFGHFEIVLGYT